RDAAAGQLDAETVEEAEPAAGEIRIVVDRVEAAGRAVARIAVARRVEEAEARPEPVVIERQLQRGHAGADADGVAVLQRRIRPGQRIKRVAAEDAGDGVVDGDAAE